MSGFLPFGRADFFAPVNGAARLFAALYVAQGPWRPGLRWRGGLRALVGSALILYTMILYPAIGALNGESRPRMPALGITPRPVTLLTLAHCEAWQRRRGRAAQA